MSFLIETQPFPLLNYIKKGIIDKHIIIEQYETFQKMSFRNRFVIAGANALLHLSIPIKGGREQKNLIKEVEIDYATNWNTKFWRSIISSYNSAPYFEYYKNDVEKLLFLKEKYLLEFNIIILKWVYNTLKTNVLIDLSSSFLKPGSAQNDYRGKTLPKNFQQNGEVVPIYSQVFEDKVGFQPNLSILDLLFCEGPNSLTLLTKGC